MLIIIFSYDQKLEKLAHKIPFQQPPESHIDTQYDHWGQNYTPF